MLSATVLGIVFAAGAVATAALAWFRGPTLWGTVAKGATIAFVILAAAAFLL